MATSNQYSFNMTVMELIEDAIQQCGLPSSSISAEVIRIAIRQLNLLQQEMVNRGTNLWALQRHLIPLYSGQKTYELPERTVDLINVQVRRVQRNATTTSGTGTPFASSGNANLAFDENFDTALVQILPDGYVGFHYNSNQNLTCVGFRTQGDVTNHYVIESSVDGVTYSTVLDLGVQDYIDNTWNWYDVDTKDSGFYWRIRETDGNFVSIRELSYSYNDYELQTAAYNRDDYFNLPFKNTSGRPYNYWFDRQAPNPRLFLWPAPDNTYEIYVVLLHRHIQDVVSVKDNVEIPRRWLDAFSRGLAARISLQIPEATARFAQLKQLADESMNWAEIEETDRSVTYFDANIRTYTRNR